MRSREAGDCSVALSAHIEINPTYESLGVHGTERAVEA
jgi:hypothetical protein